MFTDRCAMMVFWCNDDRTVSVYHVRHLYNCVTVLHPVANQLLIFLMSGGYFSSDRCMQLNDYEV